MSYYQSHQIKHIVRHVPRVPKFLILGGPADGDEAQCAVKRWPGIYVIGCEPSVLMRLWQVENGWPDDCAMLLPYALSDACGEAIMHQPSGNPRCSSLMADRPGEDVRVVTVTIDWLDAHYGPITDAILWLDIEGYEYEALVGATELFRRGGVMLANVEILERRREATERIEEFFAGVGFELVHVWNQQPGLCQDRVYVSRKW